MVSVRCLRLLDRKLTCTSVSLVAARDTCGSVRGKDYLHTPHQLRSGSVAPRRRHLYQSRGVLDLVAAYLGCPYPVQTFRSGAFPTTQAAADCGVGYTPAWWLVVQVADQKHPLHRLHPNGRSRRTVRCRNTAERRRPLHHDGSSQILHPRHHLRGLEFLRPVTVVATWHRPHIWHWRRVVPATSPRKAHRRRKSR